MGKGVAKLVVQHEVSNPRFNRKRRRGGGGRTKYPKIVTTTLENYEL